VDLFIVNDNETRKTSRSNTVSLVNFIIVNDNKTVDLRCVTTSPVHLIVNDDKTRKTLGVLDDIGGAKLSSGITTPSQGSGTSESEKN
jgi:hypothetical protein